MCMYDLYFKNGTHLTHPSSEDGCCILGGGRASKFGVNKWWAGGKQPRQKTSTIPLPLQKKVANNKECCNTWAASFY